jgi:phage-related protein
MDNITVNLDGISTEIKRCKIPLKKLILDIENPRIQYFLDTRLNDNITQDKIKFALAEGNDQYEKLKEHIERNGGIYDPIWVVPKGEYFIVIEGNTRAFNHRTEYIEYLCQMELII